MQAVLADVKRRFPEHAEALRVGQRGDSIQKRQKSTARSGYTTVCVAHCREKYSCTLCGVYTKFRSARQKQQELASAKGQLESLRERFPDYDLQISRRRINGQYRVVRRYDSHQKFYRVCLKHCRLYKQCPDCRCFQASEDLPQDVPTLMSPVVGQKRAADGVQPEYKRSQQRKQRKDIEGVFRYMTGRFPRHTLRIGLLGRTIQRHTGQGKWVTVCTLHCKEARLCKECGFARADYPEKREKMVPILKDMQRRFPDYKLGISSRCIGGEFRIVRTYPNAKIKKAYALCIPHGKLLKQCREGCERE